MPLRGVRRGTVSLLTTYLITSNMLPIATVDDFIHRHRRCY